MYNKTTFQQANLCTCTIIISKKTHVTQHNKYREGAHKTVGNDWVLDFYRPAPGTECVCTM